MLVIPVGLFKPEICTSPIVLKLELFMSIHPSQIAIALMILLILIIYWGHFLVTRNELPK